MTAAAPTPPGPRVLVLLLVVVLVSSAAGCRSDSRPGGAKDPGASLGPPGPGNEPDGVDAGGDSGRKAGPGGVGSASGSGPGGSAGGSSGAAGGAGPLVGSPDDPGAGPARSSGWRPLPPGPLRGRHDASAAWTGREMIVWGGAWRAGNASIWLDDGAAYDPAANQWRRIAESPLASRSEAFAAWTGREVLVWGGQKRAWPAGYGDEFSDGALYDPAGDRWRPMAAWPLAERYGARAVWTGSRLVVWGGASASAGEDPPPRADGAVYDPETDRWTPMAPGPLSGRIAPLGAARGRSVLFSWGLGAVRDGRRVPATDSALYDPAGNRWTPTSPAPPPPGQTWCLDPSRCFGIDSGDRVVFAGQGLAWDPSSGRWSAIASDALGDPLLEGKAVASTGDRIVLWGGGTVDRPGDVPPATVTGDGAAYDPAGDRWAALPAAPLRPRARAAAVWTGREFVVWGGEGDDDHRAQFGDGAAYTP